MGFWYSVGSFFKKIFTSRKWMGAIACVVGSVHPETAAHIDTIMPIAATIIGGQTLIDTAKAWRGEYNDGE